MIPLYKCYIASYGCVISRRTWSPDAITFPILIAENKKINWNISSCSSHHLGNVKETVIGCCKWVFLFLLDINLQLWDSQISLIVPKYPLNNHYPPTLDSEVLLHWHPLRFMLSLKSWQRYASLFSFVWIIIIINFYRSGSITKNAYTCYARLYLEDYVWLHYLEF